MQDLNFSLHFGTNADKKAISFCIHYSYESDFLLITDTSSEYINTGSKVERLFDSYDDDTEVESLGTAQADLERLVYIKNRWSGNLYRRGTQKQHDLLVKHGMLKASYDEASRFLLENDMFFEENHAFGSGYFAEPLPQDVLDEILELKEQYYYDDPIVSHAKAVF